MLVYAALTVAGVIAAAVVVWMLRSLTVASKSAYRTMSPAGRSLSQAKLAHLNSNLQATPAPWGWGNDRGNTPHHHRFDQHRTSQEPASRSKSRDWSSLELYARSNEKTARERDRSSPAVGSVRNVLTGYDMERDTSPDTSSWPYQDSLKVKDRVSEVSENTLTGSDGDRPTKPWGW